MTPLVLSDHQKQDIREAVEEIRRVMRDIEITPMVNCSHVKDQR